MKKEIVFLLHEESTADLAMRDFLMSFRETCEFNLHEKTLKHNGRARDQEKMEFGCAVDLVIYFANADDDFHELIPAINVWYRDADILYVTMSPPMGTGLEDLTSSKLMILDLNAPASLGTFHDGDYTHADFEEETLRAPLPTLAALEVVLTSVVADESDPGCIHEPVPKKAQLH